MTDVYKTADKTLNKFLKDIFARFSAIRKPLQSTTDSLAVFDQLHVLYRYIASASRDVYLKVLQDAYDAEAENRKRRFDEEFIIIMLDDEPDANTTVVFSKELERRADRFAEKVVSVLNRVLLEERKTDEQGHIIPLQTELKKIFTSEFTAVSLLLTEQEISAVDTARGLAFEDDGVEKVMWVTQLDGRECDYCRSLNHRVFLRHRVPAKPHPRCRCYTVRWITGR